MGRYIDWNDVVARYPDIAKIGGAEQVNSAWVWAAEAEVDGRLGVRYATPFVNTPAPDLVRDLAIDLAYYRATFRQDSSKELYQSLTDRFEAIIAGTLVVTGAPINANLASFSKPDFQSAFGYDDPVNWQPSTDDLEDSEARRS